MKTEIELIEYFNNKGWSLNEKQVRLMWASYLLGEHDANQEKSK